MEERQKASSGRECSERTDRGSLRGSLRNSTQGQVPQMHNARPFTRAFRKRCVLAHPTFDMTHATPLTCHTTISNELHDTNLHRDRRAHPACWFCRRSKSQSQRTSS
eukprot:7335401-Prymnesium_polylepis.3